MSDRPASANVAVNTIRERGSRTVSAIVPTGLDVEPLELTLEPIDECGRPELHSKPGDVASINGALRRLWAAGHGAGGEPAAAEYAPLQPGANAQQTASPRREAAASPSAAAPAPATVGRDALAPIRGAIGT
jgi:hypothetical protein